MIFEGVRGTSYLGDIAIDDVSLTAGSCSQGMNLVLVRLRKYLRSAMKEIGIMICLMREVGKLMVIKWHNVIIVVTIYFSFFECSHTISKSWHHVHH